MVMGAVTTLNADPQTGFHLYENIPGFLVKTHYFAGLNHINPA